jgi:ArsR family transcriptional regulator
MSPSLNAADATPAEIRRAVDLFKVLSHPDRLRLACALGDGRVTTQKELVEEFGWPQSTAARHVAALRGAGLVTAERDGTEVHLRLGNPVALHLLETVCEWVHEAPGPHERPAARPAPSDAPLGAFLKSPSFRGVF